MPSSLNDNERSSLDYNNRSENGRSQSAGDRSNQPDQSADGFRDMRNLCDEELRSESVNKSEVEIRGFGLLTEVFKQNGWPTPLRFKLKESCTAAGLARQIGLPLDKIEAVFINRKVESLDDGLVNPGDRVSFIPLGVPGPYRVLLGITKLPVDNANE
jgi:hypothetical protein